MALSYKDVKALAQEPSPEVRGALATKLAVEFRSNRFTDTEAALAAEIFRLLLKDAHAKIRTGMAQELAHCTNVPRDIILKLAHESADISAPILQYSSVLTDEDLIAIVRSTKEVIKLCAIASREHVSETVSGSLMESPNIIVLHDLFKNRGAAINADDMTRAWDMISINPTLIEMLVERGGLPLAIAEKIYHTATGAIRSSLAKQYRFNIPTAHKAADDAKEWAILDLVKSSDLAGLENEDQVEDFVDTLHFNGRLTSSLVMRALCTGNFSVFECGLARMARVPRVNTRILLMESSGKGFRSIYEAASMPEGFFDAVRILLRVSLEETEFGRTRPADLRKRIMERMYIQKYDRTVENMEYMLSIIGRSVVANVH